MILDRCNVTKEDRKEWLDIAARGSSSQGEESRRGAEAKSCGCVGQQQVEPAVQF